MELLFIIAQFILTALFIILSYQAIKYGVTMWKFKNRKKDGSEDKDFKYFD